MAGRVVKLREQTQAFRLGKVTAAAFYITLAGAFGAKRHTMIPKVLAHAFCSFCMEGAERPSCFSFEAATPSGSMGYGHSCQLNCKPDDMRRMRICRTNGRKR